MDEVLSKEKKSL